MKRIFYQKRKEISIEICILSDKTKIIKFKKKDYAFAFEAKRKLIFDFESGDLSEVIGLPTTMPEKEADIVDEFFLLLKNTTNQQNKPRVYELLID